MSRLAFHRPARFLLPRLPDEKIVLPTPPAVQRRQAGALIAMTLPLLSSVAMAGYMITFGRPVLIIVGVLFVLVAIGTSVAMRVQMRNASRQGNRRQSLRYRSHLAGARFLARQVAAAQREHSAVAHPDLERLWAIASTYERVWERRSGDSDFLHIRVGVGDAGLVTGIQLGTRLDPLGDYDWECLRAAHRLVNRMSLVGGQPAVVDLGGCGVVSVVGPPELTAALTRAMLCQVAVLHAPDDVCIAVERSGPGEWDWVKWLPHLIEADADGPAGVVPLVAAEPEGAPPRPDRRGPRHRGTAAAADHDVHRVRAGVGVGPVRAASVAPDVSGPGARYHDAVRGRAGERRAGAGGPAAAPGRRRQAGRRGRAEPGRRGGGPVCTRPHGARTRRADCPQARAIAPHRRTRAGASPDDLPDRDAARRRPGHGGHHRPVGGRHERPLAPSADR